MRGILPVMRGRYVTAAIAAGVVAATAVFVSPFSTDVLGQSVPTAVPTTAAMQTVTLAGGGACVPVVVTWPNGTPITTVLAGIVSSGDVVIWREIPGTNRFQGYDSRYPQASDLSSVNHGDQISVCTAAGGTLSQPAS